MESHKLHYQLSMFLAKDSAIQGKKFRPNLKYIIVPMSETTEYKKFQWTM